MSLTYTAEVETTGTRPSSCRDGTLTVIDAGLLRRPDRAEHGGSQKAAASFSTTDLLVSAKEGL